MNTQPRNRRRARLLPSSLALAVLALLVLPQCTIAQDAEATVEDSADAAVQDATTESSPQATAEGAESMSLKADEEDTVLRSLVIEGEDRIQIEFERPELDLHIDGYGIEGLRWGETMDVVQRREVDALTPMVHDSNDGRAKGLARPWLQQLRDGSVARFRPKMDDVASWRLTIADSRGDTVRVFSGKGSLPEQIAWNGVNDNGELALPGLVYSYVLEAKDKAGNRRNFVGPGFEVAPYRIENDGQFHIVLSGNSLIGPGASTRPVGMSDPWVLEAASWMNQYCTPEQTIEIHVSARNFEMAEAMGEIVRVQMAEQLPGSPLRLRVTTEASSEAPPAGVVTIGAEI